MNREDAIGLLRSLVSIPSVNPRCNPDPAICGEHRLAEFLKKWADQHGIAVRRYETEQGWPCLLFTAGNPDPAAKTLLWDAHMDTVWPAGMESPFELKDRGDGTFGGLGAVDDKGCICAALLALLKIKDRPLPCRVQLLCTCDEEAGFAGIDRMVPAEVRPDAAIVMEGTSLDVITASKGTVRYKITVRGKAAHSSQLWLGENAVYKILPLIAATERKSEELMRSGRKHPLLGTATLNLGVLTGGSQVNSVPDSCSFLLDRRVLPGETVEAVCKEIRAIYDPLDIPYEMSEPFFVTMPFEEPAGSKLPGFVLDRIRKHVPGAKTRGVMYSAETSSTAACGIPSVLFGPGSIDSAHSPDEHIEPGEIVIAAECLADLAEHFRGF
ncbi:MAG: M20/M25/M40 family metallo-hydrolase [Lentisphaeria bacterium]|nr:M20/M25/M40 family metallo-hydrolase [Lentisphaeria bacterium]